MKLDFPIIGLSEHKIGLNTPINNISLPAYVFCFIEKKAPMVEQDFFLLKSNSHLPKKCVICCIEGPLKMMKNAFYFILKAPFVLKIFKFLS